VASGDVERDGDDDHADEEDGDEEHGESQVALSQLPAVVRKAAERAVPGLRITGAERETEDGVIVYDVNGTSEGKAFDVEVTAAGKVLGVENDADDDEANAAEDDD